MPPSWFDFQGDCTSGTGKGECAPSPGAATWGTRRRRRAPAAGHDQMTLFVTRKRLHMQYPPDPLEQMDSPGHSAQSRGRLRGQYPGGNTKHRRKRRVRCKLGGKADRLVRIVDRYMPRIAEENRIFVMVPDKVERCCEGPAGSAERSGQGEGSDKGKQPHRQRTSHHRRSDLPIWGRMPSSTMTEVLWKTLLQIGGGQPRGLGHGKNSGKRPAKQRGRKPTRQQTHGRGVQRGDLQTQEEVKECLQKGPQNRRELLNQRGRHQLHNGGIPSHCCRTNAGMRCGRCRPTWPSFQDTVRGRRGDHNEKVSAGKIRQSCRLVGGMIGCYMFPLLSDMVLYEVTFTRCPAAGLACISQAANLQLD